MQLKTGDGLTGKRQSKRSLLPFKKERYSKRTFLKIFTYSIFLSLCVLLLTLFILFYSFKSITTKEIHNQSISLLIQAQSIFNSLHEWIIPSFRQVKSEPAISALIYSGFLDKIAISAGIERLLEILSAYYLLDSVYVYNHQTGQYFSTINGYEGTECSDAGLPEILNNIRRYGVYRYISRKMTYRIHEKVYRGDFAEIDTVNVFSIVVGDMPDSGPSMKSALIVNISEQKIRENFFHGRMMIIDKEGRVLTHPDQGQFGASYLGVPYVQKIMQSGKEEGVFEDAFAGRKYLVSYTTHPAWGWRFINVMPYEEIFSKLTDFMAIAMVVFILLMFLSVGLAYISSWRIYSPIHQLFQDALNLKMAAPSRRMSELQYVDQVLKEIIKNADNMSDAIVKHQEMHKQDLIRALVLGELDAEAPASLPEYLGTDLGEGPFIIAVMRLDNFQKLSEAYHADEIARFLNVLKELVSRYIPASRFILPLQKDHICVICNSQSPVEELAMELAAIQETVKRQLGATISVALSDPFPSYTYFHDNYSACLSATQFRFRLGGNAMIRTRDVEKAQERDYVFPEEKLHLLFQELSLGKITKVEQLIDEILASVREHDFEDYAFMVQLITYQTSKYLEKLNRSLKSSTLAIKGLLQLVKSAETLQELKGRLMETYTLIAEMQQKKQSGRLEELAVKIRAYIEHHFKDVSLCTDSISEVMGVSAYYIRFAYKKVFGESLSEAVNNLRLEYCKDQLLSTRLPIKRIYKTAGFYNYSYFFTLFKKNTGSTPNQFRFQKLASQ